MLKNFFYIFIAAACIGGTTCDVQCFLQRMKNPFYTNLLAGVDRMCMNYPTMLQSLREDVKICDVNKISLNGMELFFREFCAPNSILMQNLIVSLQCLAEKMPTLKCGFTIIGGTATDKAKEECDSRGEMMRCIINGAGKPCGPEGKQFTERAVRALDSFYAGFCAEVGGTAINTVTLWSLLLGVVLFVMNWY